jgi:hypothetical protein
MSYGAFGYNVIILHFDKILAHVIRTELS